MEAKIAFLRCWAIGSKRSRTWWGLSAPAGWVLHRHRGSRRAFDQRESDWPHRQRCQPSPLPVYAKKFWGWWELRWRMSFENWRENCVRVVR